MSAADHALYGLLWLSFGLGHSLLAHPPVRRRIAARVGAAERLTYNAVATVHIAVVLGLGWALAGGGVWDLPVWLRVAQATLALAGVAVLVVGMRGYDAGRFLGTWQLRHGIGPEGDDESEALATGGLHRHVRHPLYSGAMALLWGLAQSDFGLATAIWGTLYVWIGSRFEERKLLRRFGPAYESYRARVPAFVPWKL